MPMRIAAIVEGHGEAEAVPALIRRIAYEIDPGLVVQVEPIRVSRSAVLREGEIERRVELAARRSNPGGAILILLDADDDCPAEFGPELLARAREARGDRAITVVLAQREFEAWFLAAADSLRAADLLPEDFQAPTEPEAIRGAKERLRDATNYSPSVDQHKFVAKMDFVQATSAPSFARCQRKIAELIEELLASEAAR